MNSIQSNQNPTYRDSKKIYYLTKKREIIEKLQEVFDTTLSTEETGDFRCYFSDFNKSIAIVAKGPKGFPVTHTIEVFFQKSLDNQSLEKIHCQINQKVSKYLCDIERGICAEKGVFKNSTEPQVRHIHYIIGCTCFVK